MKRDHLDLFSGIGGFSLAAKWAGFETLAHCEKMPFPRAVLMKNFPDVPICEDVNDFNDWFIQRFGNRDVTLLTGGFPCQDISTANTAGEGITGDRSGLWFAMLSIIERIRPYYVVAENVPNLVNRGIDTVLSGLETAGYTCAAFVVGAWVIGAPHKRDRVFIVAERNDVTNSYSQRQSQPERSIKNFRGRAIHIGETVGDTCRSGCGGFARRGAGKIAQNGYVRIEERHWQVGNADLPGREEQWEQFTAGAEFTSSERTSSRITEPGMGRDADGVPGRLDGSRFFVGFPKEPTEDGSQFPCEPPRLIRGTGHRVQRLHGLGNALVPQQAYPILLAIRERIEALIEA